LYKFLHKVIAQLPKVQLHTMIDKDTLDKLRDLVSVKYEGYAGGQLSMEVEQAIQSWLAAHKQNTLFPAKGMKANPAPKSLILKYQIYQYLKEARGLERPYTISVKFLHEAIGALRGSDPRTIARWMDELVKFGQIKLLYGGEIVEFT
jgi:hypothetical protein